MNGNFQKFAVIGLILAAICLLVGCSCGDDGELPLDTDEELGSSALSELTDAAETYLSGFADTLPESSAAAVTETAAETEPRVEETAVQIVQNSLEFESCGNGTCKVKGIGDCTDACVVIPERSPAGDVVVAIADRAFYDCQGIVAIQIPSGVTMIGDQAFGSCQSLVYISVSRKNPMFCDVGGVLYSADGTRIIAYPAGSSASEYSIPRAVRSIAPMAFYNCRNLRVINFGGTQEQWAGISIGAYNYSVNTAAIYCIDDTK